MPSGNPSACTVSTCPPRQNRGWTAPALAICSVCFSSFQTAKTMVTYCASIFRSCRESFSCFNMAAGESAWLVAARRIRWQETQLYVARHVEIVLQTLFLLRHPAIQPRVLDSHRNLRGEGYQGPLVILVEVVDLDVLQVEHPDHLALIEQRHRHLRA